MTKQELQDIVLEQLKEIEKPWGKIVGALTKYVEEKGEGNTSYTGAFGDGQVDSWLDALCLKRAWVIDCLDGKLNLSAKRSERKKTRKFLGYSYP